VGLEIFRYSIASSVVKTTSFSIIDIELPPFVLIFVYLEQNICQEKVKGFPFNNCLIFKVFLWFLKTYQLGKASWGVETICRNLGIIVKPSDEDFWQNQEISDYAPACRQAGIMSDYSD
jgi:hypothetical protein